MDAACTITILLSHYFQSSRLYLQIPFYIRKAILVNLETKTTVAGALGATFSLCRNIRFSWHVDDPYWHISSRSDCIYQRLQTII